MPVYSHLTKGLNLFGLTAGVSMEPGESVDAMNILPRVDGSFMSHWGGRRLNATALSTPVLAQIGFTYKGKNNNTAINPGRPGNFGLADDGNGTFSRRVAHYSGTVVLTENEARFWNPVTRALSAAAITLPAGFSIDPLPRPTLLILQNNVYIVGWGSHNLRYDPVDRALYIWGWDSSPTMNDGSITVVAGGTLRASSIYKYRAAWVNLYTGEQSELGPVITKTTTAANRTVNFAAGAFAAYAGLRHFVDGVNLTNQDVGIVLYRTEANEEAFYFLDLLTPSLAAETVVDNGLSTDMRRKATTLDFQDPKRYSGAAIFRNTMYGFSWADGEGMTRLYRNDFTTVKSHFERTQALNYDDLPLTNGEFVTAVAPLETSTVIFSNKNAYHMQSMVNKSLGIVQHAFEPMRWTVGCVGPLAWEMVDGWLYFLSDRGPYRWRPGIEAPQWIGKNLAPLFTDPMSGMCKLNPAAKAKSEVFYDMDADVIRFVFPTGNSKINNEHIYWWVRPEFNNNNPYQGWFFGQKFLNASSFTHAYGGMNAETGAPESQLDRAARHVWADNLGYLYEYDPGLTTMAPDAMQGFFIANGGSTITATVIGGLYTTGDGLSGLQIEVVHLASGLSEVRTIASNSETVLVVADAFDEPVTAGDSVWVGGMIRYWRSWLDHGGEPTMSKKSVHFYLGLQQTGSSESRVDLTMATGDNVPTEPLVEEKVPMNANNQKTISSLVGRWFIWEVANSRPHEMFHVTFLKTDLQPLRKERL